MENHRDKKIKFLRSDRGDKYLSYEFGLQLKQCGIVSQLTPPGTPQRNGVSERRNHTLLDMVRYMISHTDLPLSFWGYALETAAFTLNREPSKSIETTQYELWFSNKYLAFGSVIEGVPNSFLWVSYEDTFLRFGFELIWLKLFHISIAAPIFKKRQLWFLAKP